MKSKYLSIYPLEEKEKGRFATLQKISDKLFKEVYNWLDNQTSLPDFTTEITEKFVKSTGEIPETVDNTIISCYYFIKVFDEYDDITSDFIEDVECNYSELVSKRDVLESRLSELHALATRYSNYFRIEETLMSGPTFLKSSSIAVVSKPVFKDLGRNKDEMTVEDYDPKIIGYKPSIIIEMKKANDEIFTFQMDSSSLNRFIRHLLFKQKELKTLENDE